MNLRSDPLARRAAWTFVGQALSSSSNFLVTLWALTTLSAPDFAAFSLCITTYLLIVQLSRALVSVPVLVLYSEEPGSTVPSAAGAALGASVGSGLVAGAAVAVAAAVLSRLTVIDAPLFLVLAATLPLLQYQDTLRHVCIARQRPMLAAASDMSWLVLQVGGLVLLSRSGHPSATAVFAVWAIAGAASGVWAGAALGVRPQLRLAGGWLRRHRVLCRRLVIEFAASSGSYYLIAYGIVVVAGAEELGHLRAAQALFGPASVLLLGGTMLGLPETLRARGDTAALRRFTARLSAALALVSLLSGALLFALLPLFGPRFLPGAEETARPLLPLLALFGAGIGAAAGALAGLRATGDGAWIVRAQVVRGGLAVLVGLPAASVFGANGALAGLAVAESVFAAATWARFTRLDLVAPDPLPPAAVAVEDALSAVSR